MQTEKLISKGVIDSEENYTVEEAIAAAFIIERYRYYSKKGKSPIEVLKRISNGGYQGWKVRKII